MTGLKTRTLQLAGGLAAQVAIGLIVAIIITIGLHPVANWPHSHEHLRYLVLTELFAEGLAAGIPYPRWLPDLSGGYGYPTFVFYQPAFFSVASMTLPLSGSAATSVYLAVLAFLTLGFVGAYRLGRQFGDERLGGFVAILFLLTPYLFVDLFVRGDLTELAAMMLTPWALLMSNRIQAAINSGSPASLRSVGLGVVLGGMAYCHPMVAILTAASLAVVAVVIAIGGTSPARLVVAASIAASVAAIVSLPYAAPLVFMSRHAEIERAISGRFLASDHLLWPAQLLAPTWGYGPSLPGPADGMSFQLGWPHAALALAGAVAGRRSRFLVAAYVAHLVMLVVATVPFAPLWGASSPLRLLQFPWRVLSVTAALQAVSAGGLSRWMPADERLRTALYVVLLLPAVLIPAERFGAYPGRYRDADQIVRDQRARMTHSFQAMNDVDEFRPRSAARDSELPPRGDAPIAVTTPVRPIECVADDPPFRVACTVGAGRPAAVTINQFYFPGWHVEIDGAEVEARALETALAPDGRIRVHIGASGAQRLTARYAGPPGGWWRATATALLLGLVALLIAADRRAAQRTRRSFNAPA